jgi:NADH-quinone oxidoreductase subunit A
MTNVTSAAVTATVDPESKDQHVTNGDRKVVVLKSYLPALVFVGLGTVVGLAFAVLNAAFGPRRNVPHKQDPYECGLPSEVKHGFRFGISFYLIAMLFILFDIEVIFLYPVAIQLKAFGTFALIEITVFIALLMAALVYVWRRGALEWK